jgi:hypothetical protein
LAPGRRLTRKNVSVIFVRMIRTAWTIRIILISRIIADRTNPAPGTRFPTVSGHRHRTADRLHRSVRSFAPACGKVREDTILIE